MPHKLRKTRKMRGSRTHGYGQVAQHRVGGIRGSRKADRNRRGSTYVLALEPSRFRKGFTSPRSVGRKNNVINVGELEELASRLDLKREKGKLLLDLDKLGYTKLLGMGKITKPFSVKVAAFSEKAAKKIEEAGGKILKEQN